MIAPTLIWEVTEEHVKKAVPALSMNIELNISLGCHSSAFQAF